MVSENLMITLNAFTAQRLPEHTQILQFDIRAAGLPGGQDKAALDDWYAKAHEATGATFVAVTDKEIRDHYWDKRSSP